MAHAEKGPVCKYNQDTERLCLDAYDRGDRTTLREVIDELRASDNTPRIVTVDEPWPPKDWCHE